MLESRFQLFVETRWRSIQWRCARGPNLRRALRKSRRIRIYRSARGRISERVRARGAGAAFCVAGREFSGLRSWHRDRSEEQGGVVRRRAVHRAGQICRLTFHGSRLRHVVDEPPADVIGPKYGARRKARLRPATSYSRRRLTVLRGVQEGGSGACRSSRDSIDSAFWRERPQPPLEMVTQQKSRYTPAKARAGPGDRAGAAGAEGPRWVAG